MSALVVGAVAPDLPVYLPVGASYATTHSWPGLPVVVFFGMVLLWLWFAVVRDALVDLTPVLRHRVPAHARLERRAWLLAPIAVAIGAATHVLWDSVTHDYGFVVHHLTFLSEEYGPLPLYRWAQHTSTVVGSIVVAAYGWLALRGRPLAPRSAAVRRPALWWAAVAASALIAGTVLRDVEAAIGATLVASVGLAIVWRITTRHERVG